MDSQNPYQAPPPEFGHLTSAPRGVGYFPYAFVICKLTGLGSIAVLAWFASARHSAHNQAAMLFLWGLLFWTALGAAAAVGVTFRYALAKHILVVHLILTAACELYGFTAMMHMTVPAPLTDMAQNFGWVYFLLALWDLGWAALFQFSPALRQALR